VKSSGLAVLQPEIRKSCPWRCSVWRWRY